jgi:hypothetical protein
MWRVALRIAFGWYKAAADILNPALFPLFCSLLFSSAADTSVAKQFSPRPCAAVRPRREAAHKAHEHRPRSGSI